MIDIIICSGSHIHQSKGDRAKTRSPGGSRCYPKQGGDTDQCRWGSFHLVEAIITFTSSDFCKTSPMLNDGNGGSNTAQFKFGKCPGR